MLQLNCLLTIGYVVSLSCHCTSALTQIVLIQKEQSKSLGLFLHQRRKISRADRLCNHWNTFQNTLIVLSSGCDCDCASCAEVTLPYSMDNLILSALQAKIKLTQSSESKPRGKSRSCRLCSLDQVTSDYLNEMTRNNQSRPKYNVYSYTVCVYQNRLFWQQVLRALQFYFA